MFNNKQKTDDLCEVGCAAKGFAVGAENADEVIFGLLKWAGKGADRASENCDKKCSKSGWIYSTLIARNRKSEILVLKSVFGTDKNRLRICSLKWFSESFFSDSKPLLNYWWSCKIFSGFCSLYGKMLPQKVSKTGNKKWLETEVSNHWKAIYNAGWRSIVHVWRPLLYQLSYTPKYLLCCFRCKLFACEKYHTTNAHQKSRFFEK